MTNGHRLQKPLVADLRRLTPVPPEIVVAALAGLARTLATPDDALARVRNIYGDEGAAMLAVNAALAKDYAVLTDGSLCLSSQGTAALDDVMPAHGKLGETDVFKTLAALALGISVRDKKKMAALSRLEAMQSAALSILFGLELGETPSRSAVRFAFARHLLMERFADYTDHLATASARAPRPHALIAALITGYAGGSHTSLTEAETHMLSNALGAKTKTKSDLARSLIRAASAPQLRPQRETTRPMARKGLDVVEFAGAVRRIAKTMETKPYAGRVAIAQVYDAGLAEGLEFGALEEFKRRVAEACRAGHLDLERYDIAGPMDATLRDRSRTPFGRDERHFIVNQWI